MIEDLNPYPAMKDSGVEWLGAVPKHWDVRRLRTVANLRVSNVDKHARVGEPPVRLCNYVDVYKHDYINQAIEFMHSTASLADIERFRLMEGDVLITKDSESWDDIGVPALVTETSRDLISGYHLALLRPQSDALRGGYLLRSLQSQPVAHQLYIAATGVTRFGLSHASIRSTWVPTPPLDEQDAIVRYLDHVDRRVRRLVEAKRKLIELLTEQKQAIIHQAVTRGLDPDVPLKDSGVGWLGQVPAHWEVRRVKALFRETDERSVFGLETLLSLRMHAGLVPHNQVSTKPISASGLIGYKRVQPGQLVMNRMRAAIGVFGVPEQMGLVSPDYAVFEPAPALDMSYFMRLFKLPAMCAEFRTYSKGLGTGSSGFMRLYSEQFGSIRVPCPPPPEQQLIAEYLSEATADIESVESRALREIQLLNELRDRITADAVTGRIDVREAAAALPEVDPSDLEDALDVDGENELDGIFEEVEA